MFFNSQRIAFSITMFSIAFFSAGDSFGQYGSRNQMMRRAQMRGSRQSQTQSYRQETPRSARPTRVAQGSGTRNQSSPIQSAPVQNSPLQSSPIIDGSSPIIGGPSSGVSGYTPLHMRGGSGNQVISEGPIVDGGSPIISDGYYEDDGSVMYQDGGCGCGDAGCGGDCGVGQCYFDSCQPCCGQRNGGCCPECWNNCWLRGLGGFLQNSEWFAGAAAFRSNNFRYTNNIVNDELVDDSSFGFYGGVNLGLPLCYLTCGLLTGQVGFRAVVSDFERNFFTNQNREQYYLTTGLFRRVDYGFQMGVVGDFLREDWFTRTELSQVRGDFSWVYPGGSAFGFRFAAGTRNDDTFYMDDEDGVERLFAQVIDNYRFYYRFTATNCGFGDIFAGWSDNSHGIIGLDYDMPVTRRWAMQSGFTYYIPDDSEQAAFLETRDIWNIFVGFSFRPQGAAWYGNYDRPLFNVADNGTFTWGRF